jgi:dTDP-4-dehydrorhamnose reductase
MTGGTPILLYVGPYRSYRQAWAGRSRICEAGPSLDAVVIPLGRPELDLEAPETIERSLPAAAPDIVVNAAAYTAVDQAEREPAIASAVNGTGAGVVAAVARALNVPVIHLSTDYVFDGSKTSAYVEEDMVAPACAYGASKSIGEQAVAAANNEHVILRTAWVYAPFGKNFVRTMLALAQSRGEVRVVADQHGCPTYAPDIAAAIIGIARNILRNRSDPLCAVSFILPGAERQAGPALPQRSLLSWRKEVSRHRP